MPLVNPFDLVDPGNMLGTRKTPNEKRRDRLIAAQEKYAKIYREAEALGLPLEKMGFPKPVGQILAAGMGGTPGGGGFPAFIPPIVPSQAGGGAVSEQEIEDELRRSEELQDRIDYISIDDFISRADYEDEINASNVRPPTRIPSIGQSRREWINPYGKGNSKKIKEWKGKTSNRL